MVKLLCTLIALSLFAVAPLAGAQTVAPAAGQYELDPRHSSVHFRINHMGFSRTWGRINGMRATLTLDPSAPDRSAVSATMEAQRIDSGLPTFDEYLRGPSFLNAAEYPEISFRSTGILLTGANTADVVGDLTLHGQAHPVTLHVIFNAAGPNPFDQRTTTGFSATAAISRAQFGLNAFPEMVSDEIELFVEAEFRLSPAQ